MRGVVAAVVAAVVLVACVGDDAAPPTTTRPSTVDPAGSTEVATATTVPAADVFAALAGDDPDQLTQASSATEPGSPAARYVDYLAAARRITRTPGCGTACPMYSDPEFDRLSGRLAGFAVDGTPVAGRVSGAGTEVWADTVAVHVAGAYLTATGDLFVVLAARNTADEPADLFAFATVFQPAGSTTATDAAAWWGDPFVPSGDETRVLVKFPAAGSVDGTLRLAAVTGSGLDISAAIEVPAP